MGSCFRKQLQIPPGLITSEDQDVLKYLNVNKQDQLTLYEPFSMLGGIDARFLTLRQYRELGAKSFCPFGKKYIVKFTGRDGTGPPPEVNMAELDSNSEFKRITFVHFVVAIWIFCTATETGIFELLFDVFDKDEDGLLSYEEAKTAVGEVFGSGPDKMKLLKPHVDSLRALAAQTADRTITRAGFVDWCRKHEPAVQPLVTYQRAVRAQLLGEQYWQIAVIYREAHPNMAGATLAQLRTTIGLQRLPAAERDRRLRKQQEEQNSKLSRAMQCDEREANINQAYFSSEKSFSASKAAAEESGRPRQLNMVGLRHDFHRKETRIAEEGRVMEEMSKVLQWQVASLKRLNLFHSDIKVFASDPRAMSTVEYA